jgi:hypothetical protein
LKILIKKSPLFRTGDFVLPCRRGACRQEFRTIKAFGTFSLQKIFFKNLLTFPIIYDIIRYTQMKGAKQNGKES